MVFLQIITDELALFTNAESHLSILQKELRLYTFLLGQDGFFYQVLLGYIQLVEELQQTQFDLLIHQILILGVVS